MTPERRQELESALQRSGRSTMTPERRQELESALTRASQPQQTNLQKLGAFGRDIVHGVAKTAASAVSPIAATRALVGGLARGEDHSKIAQAAEHELTRERRTGLGKVRPVGVHQDTGEFMSAGRGALDILGTGLETGTTIAPVGAGVGLVGRGATKVGQQALQQGGRTLFKQGARLGVGEGAGQLGGRELQDPTATVGSVIGHTAAGAVGGGVLGGFGAAAPTVARGLVGKTKDVAGPSFRRLTGRPLVDEAKEAAVTAYRNVFGSTKRQARAIDDFKARTGDDITEYLVEHKVPIRSSDNGTKFATKELAEDIRQETIEMLEESMQSVLGAFKGSRSIDLLERAAAAKRVVASDPLAASLDITKRLKHIDDFIGAEIARYGRVVDPVIANNIKRAMWGRAFSVADTEINPAARKLGSALREGVEQSVDSPIVRETNQELLKAIKAADFLDMIHGDAVKGGRLTRQFSRIVGGIAGAKAGPIGAIVGSEALMRLVAKLGNVDNISNKAIKRLMDAGNVIPSSIKTVQAAREFLEQLAGQRKNVKLLGPGAIPLGPKTPPKSGLIKGRQPRVLPQEARPGQLLLPPGRPGAIPGETINVPPKGFQTIDRPAAVIGTTRIVEPKASIAGTGIQAKLLRLKSGLSSDLSGIIDNLVKDPSKPINPRDTFRIKQELSSHKSDLFDDVISEIRTQGSGKPPGQIAPSIPPSKLLRLKRGLSSDLSSLIDEALQNPNGPTFRRSIFRIKQELSSSQSDMLDEIINLI